MAITEDWILC